jgi:hypothetical protein
MLIRRAAVVTAAFILLATPLTAGAQPRWTLEFLPGVGVPTQRLAEADLRTGRGLEGTVGYRVLPHLSVYGGWSWHRFTSREWFVGPDIDIYETGYAFGLRFEHPTNVRRTSVMVRLGGTYNHLELEDPTGVSYDSGHGLGWEAGTGVVIWMTDHWRFTPTVRFRSTARELVLDGMVMPAPLRYVAVGFGISRVF